MKRLSTVGAVGVVLATAAAMSGCDHQSKPSGHTTIALHATTRTDAGLADTAVGQAREILLRRLKAAGFPDATAEVRGSDTVVVTLPGTVDIARIEELAAPGELRFRRVLLDSAAAPAGPAPSGAVGAASPGSVVGGPAQRQYADPAVTCDALDNRPPGAVSDASQQVVACGSGVKYLLDVAKVTGADVSDARVPDDDKGNGPSVMVSFTAAGQARWTQLTREAFNQLGADGQNGRVAIVVDNRVVSAPSIQGVITGDAQITGLDKAGARRLAAQLTSGALPVVFTRAENASTGPTAK